MSNAVELFQDRANELREEAQAKGIKARIHIENPMAEKSWYLGQVCVTERQVFGDDQWQIHYITRGK